MREPPKVWPEQGEDYANNMPVTELREGDQFWVEGPGEVPGKATVTEVLNIVDGDVYAMVKFPAGHCLGYVDRVPL